MLLTSSKSVNQDDTVTVYMKHSFMFKMMHKEKFHDYLKVVISLDNMIT